VSRNKQVGCLVSVSVGLYRVKRIEGRSYSCYL